MRLNRLRRGEWIALIGAVGLFVVMFLDWYEPRGFYFGSVGPESGWSGVGWFAVGSVVLTILVCGYWLLATATHDSPAIPVAGEVVTVVLGAITSLALLARLVFQPGPNALTELELGAYLGPALAIALTAGAWIAMADERTEAAYSQPGDIELRPLPE